MQYLFECLNACVKNLQILLQHDGIVICATSGQRCNFFLQEKNVGVYQVEERHFALKLLIILIMQLLFM